MVQKHSHLHFLFSFFKLFFLFSPQDIRNQSNNQSDRQVAHQIEGITRKRKKIDGNKYNAKKKSASLEFNQFALQSCLSILFLGISELKKSLT